MSIEKIYDMLTNVPDVAQWWKTNKHTIETSEGVKRKWEERCERAMIWLALCGICTVPLVALGIGLDAFIDVTGNINGFIHMLLLSGLTGGLIAILGLLGLLVGAPILGRRHRALLSQHYQEATSRWGIDSQAGGKKLLSQHQAKIVAQLNELGMDPDHIMALRNLDLPNAWWRALNEEIVRTQNEKQEQPQVTPTLEEVFVHVEQRTEAAKTHVLRL